MESSSGHEDEQSSFGHFTCCVFLSFLLVGSEHVGGKPKFSEQFTLFKSFTASSFKQILRAFCWTLREMLIRKKQQAYLLLKVVENTKKVNEVKNKEVLYTKSYF